MSRREELEALAARVEGLAGACRETDDEIATVLFAEKQRHCIKGLSDDDGGLWMFRYPNGSIGSALGFTRSLDAAMTPAPAGLLTIEMHWQSQSPKWSVYLHYEIGMVHGYADMRAAALTAAALRAIAAQEQPA